MDKKKGLKVFRDKIKKYAEEATGWCIFVANLDKTKLDMPFLLEVERMLHRINESKLRIEGMGEILGLTDEEVENETKAIFHKVGVEP